MVIQEALLLAVQLQPLPAVTVTFPVPPVAATDWLVGEIEYVQAVWPAWETVKVCPAMVTVPVRDKEDALAATE